jgi:hypothetical protein
MIAASHCFLPPEFEVTMIDNDDPNDIPDRIEDVVRAQLERLGAHGVPFAIFDPALIDEAGEKEVRDLARLMPTEEFAVLAVPAAVLPALLPFLAPDHREMFQAGRPLVIAPVAVEDREANAAHRPTDTQLVKAAKAALETQAFRLVTAQKAAELARNNRARLLTAAEANERAKQAIGEAVWREGSDPDGSGKIGRVEGLIDRGRRLAAAFFGVENARDVGKAETVRVANRLGESLPGSAERREIVATLERDHRERAGELADHELRAKAHEGAMGRWSGSVREDAPIAFADGLDVTNGIATRQSAPTLMRVAIDGDLNPADVHRNLETMRESFEVGRLIGRLSRGHSIELTVEQAKLLDQSLKVFESQVRGSGRPETEADGCDWYLADAALSCHDLGFWTETIARILDTGAAQTVERRVP